MAVLYTPHFIQFFDDNGDPLANGKLYTYAAGTTTPKATYTTAAATVANANPIVLDSAGRAVAFLDGSYKFRLETAASVLVRETDNVSAFTTSAVTIDSILPSQSGNAGKFLTTNGATASWGTGASGLVPIATTTVSSPVTSVDFVHGTGGVIFDATYKNYLLLFSGVTHSGAGANLWLRTSTNTGSSYDSGATDYARVGSSLSYAAASRTDFGATGSTQIIIGFLDSPEKGGGSIVFIDPSDTASIKSIIFSTSDGITGLDGYARRNTVTTDIDAFRILPDSGNITGGTFKLYGYN